MALYGPAIFQVLANSVGRMEKNDINNGANYYPWSQHTITEKYGFGRGAAQANEDFKNNLFRVVMLRARNHLIKQKIANPGMTSEHDFEPAKVTVELTLYDQVIHPKGADDTDDYVIQQAILSDDQDYIELPDGRVIAQIKFNYAHLGCGSNSVKIEEVLEGELSEYGW